jgi:hypothetical protein
MRADFLFGWGRIRELKPPSGGGIGKILLDRELNKSETSL